ncbi:MAG: 50S ribosomal protein L13 [Gammaproteobacteria bacterium 39-13]|nr:50S ribosomal protein L13 [Gammaproteobacteria bacterium]OJV91514.1 MAG: 50S ribosomal protein L13 [Gammaproteobacteria bacterium 39-13]
MKTYVAKPHEIRRDWFIVDAKTMPIGRIASRVAAILRGKHKTIFTPHEDTGDAVIIINAAEVQATGKKEKTKIYHHHTGYPGGIKSVTLEKMRGKNPERILQLAIKRMLPKGPLGRKMFKKLWVYAGAEHPHQAQQPKELAF